MTVVRWWFLVELVLSLAGVVGCRELAHRAGSDAPLAAGAWTAVMYAHALAAIGNLFLLWLGEDEGGGKKG